MQRAKRHNVPTTLRRSDRLRLASKKVSPPPLLPDDIWHKVFSFLAPVQIARVEGVCKQWHQVAQSEALWKDAIQLCLYDAVTHETIRRRFDAILRRAGGRLRSIDLFFELRLENSDDSAEHLLHIAMSLPQTGVEHVGIEAHGHVQSVCIVDDYGIESVWPALSLMARSAVACGSLRSLYFHCAYYAEGIVPLWVHDPLPSALQPRLQKGTFQHLYLTGALKIFLPDYCGDDEVVAELFSSVRTLHIEEDEGYECKSNAAYVWPIVHHAKDTLEEFCLNIFTGQHVDEERDGDDELEKNWRRRTIILPKLQRLHLLNSDCIELRVGFRAKLVTPALRTLVRNGTLPPIEGLLVESLEELRIDLWCEDIEDGEMTSKALQGASRCVSLRSLAVMIGNKAEYDTLESMLRNSWPSLQELSIRQSSKEEHVNQSLVNAIAARSNNNSLDGQHKLQWLRVYETELGELDAKTVAQETLLSEDDYGSPHYEDCTPASDPDYKFGLR